MQSVAISMASVAILVSVTLLLLWVHGTLSVTLERSYTWINRLGALAVLLGAAALALGAQGLFRGLSIAALPAPLSFFALRLIARQPRRKLALSLGDPVLEFEAIDANGQTFRLASLRGQAFLLKFYRGHW